MNKRYAALLSICLIILIIGSLIWYVKPPKYTTTDAGSIAWQTTIPHFASGFAVGDGKVFTTDNSNLYCHSASSGESLWNATFEYGSYGGTQVVVYEGKVYASMGNLVVERYNENTGQAEMQYRENSFGPSDYKHTASFFLADGRVFVSDRAVYDAQTGQQFWENSMQGLKINSSITLPSSNYTYLVQDTGSLTRIDPNNGKSLWYITAYAGQPSIVAQQQVILWNYAANYGYPQTEHAIVSIDSNNGQEVWRFDTVTTIFQPTVYNDLLLFGAKDGYFYALNVANGTLNWKTKVDVSNIISQTHSALNYVSAPEPLVDTESQTVFWNFIQITTDTRNYSQRSYSGTILAIDLQNTKVKWNLPINGPSIDNIGNEHMAFINNQLFVSKNKDLLCINMDSGSIKWERTFDHYILKPIVADNEVFVVADLYLIAYK